MSSDKVIHIEGDNWQAEVIKAQKPVIVDFWAEWCGPCKAIAPIIDELAEEMADQVKFVKVNVDNNQQLAGEFGIRSIPTLLIFKEGTVQEQMMGAMNKADLQAKIQAHL